ncbi:hypothetical protein JCM10450v2_005413 [Rhodotorula kratochvilovae]
MAYNQPYHSPYGSSADAYGRAGDSPYGSAAPQNPFASEVDLHAPASATYPPQAGTTPTTGLYRSEDHAGSAWSLDDQDIATGGYDKVQRSADNPFSAEHKRGGNSVRKWVWIGIAVVVVVGAVAGGIGAWKATSGSSSSSSSSSGKMQYIDGTAKVVKSNPSNPSQFEKDSRLKQIFYGLAYTPKNVLEEYGCGATQANVTEDIQLISQLTTRIRTYSTSCNQTQMTLQAIKDTQVNMTVWIGAYVGSNQTVNEQQQQDVLDALQLYGTDHVSGITIGNEYVLGQENSAASIQYIVSQQSSFRTKLDALSLSKSLPVGTADAGSSFTSTLVAGSDYIMGEFFENNDVNLAEAAANKPTAYIAETGWPTQSMTPENATYGAAVAGVSELQTFLDTYPCQANQNQSYYFYFEPYWGLFDSNKVLKDITFPDCAVDSNTASG